MIYSVHSSNYSLNISNFNENQVSKNFNKYVRVCLNKIDGVYTKKDKKILNNRRFFVFLENKLNQLAKNISGLRNFIFYNKVALFFNKNSITQSDPHLESTLEEKHLFRDIIHTVLRDYAHPETTNLQNKYSFTNGFYQAFVSTKRAFALLKLMATSQIQIPGLTTHQEQESLLNLCKNRYNHLRYLQLLDSYRSLKTDKSPAGIEQRGSLKKDLLTFIRYGISRLSKNDHPLITQLENGSTSFTIAGGWYKHYVGFQFIRDAQDNYYFCLENRALPSQDSRFHGYIRFDHKNKKYSKCTVVIKVKLEAILNENFLLFLINDANIFSSKSNTFVYNQLENYLIDTGGEIIETELEEMLHPLGLDALDSSSDGVYKQQLNEVFSKLRSDRTYQRIQPFATCTKSNTCGIDKTIVSKKTWIVSEIHEIFYLAIKMKDRYCFDVTNRIPHQTTCLELQSHLTHIKDNHSKRFKSSNYLTALYQNIVKLMGIDSSISGLCSAYRLISKSNPDDTTLKETARLVKKLEKEIIPVEESLHKSFRELIEARILFTHMNKRIEQLKGKFNKPSLERPIPSINSFRDDMIKRFPDMRQLFMQHL